METKNIVALSGGKDSTCLALALKDREPATDFEYLITPVGNELDEMKAHWERLEVILGKKFIRLKPFTEGDGLMFLILQYRSLPNWRQRWCTRQLKIEPTIAWLSANAPCVQYVGLRADEEEREGIYGDMLGVTQRYPLREWGWGIDDVQDYLAEKGIRVPQRTDCAFCYGQRIIDWYRLWEQHPDVYELGVQTERLTGHTFRSPGRDTWPASLEELRIEFMSGRPIKGHKKPGVLELTLFDRPEEDEQPCRVCRL